MKFVKWKILIITCLVCLVPIFLGVIFWHQLPDTMAVHFNFYNEPDNFASKGFTIFGLPLLIAMMQMICCIINDVNSHKHGEQKKLEMVTKWILPVMSILLQASIIFYSLGFPIDIRKVAVLLVGTIFLVTGNYLPKLDYIKNYDIDAEKAKKINRFIGIETVIMGILGLVTIFMPPIASVVWLILLIPYAIIAAAYGIKNGRKKA